VASPQPATEAHCLARDCDWTPEGDAVDKAAERHTTKPPKHPTATVTRWAA
jgi:hypothetical protein